MSKTLQERFDDKYTPEPNTGCWLWFGATAGNGYGHIWTGTTTERAHRVSYELHKGNIPEGLELMHSCDCRHCVNPDHLTPGTRSDNVRDMHGKGRQGDYRSLGESNGVSKFTAEQVLAIRADPRSQSEIAKEHGVHKTTISHIIQRRNWKHI